MQSVNHSVTISKSIGEEKEKNSELPLSQLVIAVEEFDLIPKLLIIFVTVSVTLSTLKIQLILLMIAN